MFQTYDVSKTKFVCDPTFGKPSPDTHPLRDDEASTDRPMLTTFVDTPAKHLPVENGEVKAQKTGEGELVWNLSRMYLFSITNCHKVLFMSKNRKDKILFLHFLKNTCHFIGLKIPFTF